MVETFGPADIIITVHVVTRNCQDFTVNSEANASELMKNLSIPKCDLEGYNTEHEMEPWLCE